VHRDQIGKTGAELMATKQLYVGVCKAKDELEDQIRYLQAENIGMQVRTSFSVRVIEFLATWHLVCNITVGLY